MEYSIKDARFGSNCNSIVQETQLSSTENYISYSQTGMGEINRVGLPDLDQKSR